MPPNDSRDQTQTDIDPKRLDEFKNHVISFLTRLSTVAKGAIDKLRTLLVVSLACAAWLGYFVMTAFKLSFLQVAPALLGFAFPALLIWKLYRIIKNVAGLPEYLPELTEGIKEVYADLKGEGIERLSDLKESGEEKNRFKSLFSMGRNVMGLKKLLTGLQGKLGEAVKPGMMESVIIMTGPGFVFLITLATIGTVLLAILTLISAVAYLVVM